MKIGLSIRYLKDDPRVGETLDQCDLVIIPARHTKEAIERAKNRFGSKVVELQHCTCSIEIQQYLAKGITPFFTLKEEIAELQTIYESLPKGIELELYSKAAFAGLDKPVEPTVVTLT